MPQLDELIKHSVTRDDEQSYQGNGLVLRFMLPQALGLQYMGALPSDPPMYWTWERDVVLRATVLYESSWANAVGIACSKVSAKSFEIDGDQPRRVQQLKDMMVNLDRIGWSRGQSKGVRDFLTTDNGEFWEIVRVSNAAGSRLLGLRHLDSLRCILTGDSKYPVVYRDLRGKYHALRDDQVIHLVDMESPGSEWFGVGLCAASRSYPHIYKNANIDRYVNEKISGSNPLAIHFVSSISEKSLRSALESADAEQTRKGAVIYKGAVVVPLLGDTPASLVTVPLSELPDRFDRMQEFEISQIQYANSIGMDIQDLYPLSNQGFGTGEQSRVLYEKGKGKGLASRDKQWVHAIGEKVAAASATFFFKERDLADEQAQVDISKTRSDMHSVDIAAGVITPAQALQDAIDHNDYPKEFISEDTTMDRTMDDQEKESEEENSEEETKEEPKATAWASQSPEEKSSLLAQPDLLVFKEVAQWKNYVADYKSDIRRYAASLISEHITAKEYESLLRMLLQRYSLLVTKSVLSEAGLSEDDLTPDEMNEIAAWVKEQLKFTSGFSDFVSTIPYLSSNELDAALKELNRRVDYWGQSMSLLAGMVMTKTLADELGTWVLGHTEKHCSDCLARNGQSKRMSEWKSMGLPQNPNLACNGYGCDCSIVNSSGVQIFP